MIAEKIWVALLGIVLLLLLALLAGILAKSTYSANALRYFDHDFLIRASQYQRLGLKIFLIRQLLTWGLLAGAVFFAWNHFAAFHRPPLWLAAIYITLFFFILCLVTFPLDYFRGFVLEHRFGFSTQTFNSWLLDYAKSRFIALLITVSGLTGLYSLLIYFPGRWWWLAGTFFTLFLFLGSYLFPLIIDPLFYSFKPLEDEKMRDAIIEMAQKAEIEVGDVLVADASRRTRKANAYFSGLGKTKRIVVYDTLLTGYSREEALAVIAHEIGHWRHAHIVKGNLMVAAGAFLAFFLLHLIFQEMRLVRDIRGIALALIFFSLFSFATLPLQNTVSRAFERQADLEAVALTGKPLIYVSLKQKLARANLSDVEPHPFIKVILYTHPPVIERIEMALREAEKLK